MMMSGDASKLPSLPSSRDSSASSGRSSRSMDSMPISPRCCNNEGESDDEADTPLGNNGELYTEIETFLNKPLAAIARGSRSSENLLPTLKLERSKLRTEKPEAKRAEPKAAAPKKAPIDLNMVQQAFAYAKNLQTQQLLDGSDDGDDQLLSVIQQQLAKANMSKANNTLRSSKSAEKTATTKAVAPKKKPTKVKSASAIYNNTKPERAKATAEWDNNNNGDAKSSSSSMDPQLMQQLLSNFENGTTLQELRQELAASQASLKESRSILQCAAKSFFLKQ